MTSSNRKSQVLFPINLTKFIILSTVTFGVYDVYWMYKNWKYIQVKEKSQIRPFWRAFFGVLWLHELLNKIKKYSTKAGLKSTFSAGWRALAYLVFAAIGRVDDNAVWLLSFLSVLVFVTPIQTINAMNDKNESDTVSFSTWETICLVLGIFFWILFLLSWYIA